MFVDLQLAASSSGRPPYNPAYGRFLQPDPIGYEAGPNVYAYVGNDPVNAVDSLGLDGDLIVVAGSDQPRHTCTGTRIITGCGGGGIASGMSGFSTAGTGGQYSIGNPAPGGGYRCTNCGQGASTSANGEIVVSAPRYEWVSTSGGSQPAGFPRHFIILHAIGSVSGDWKRHSASLKV